MYVYQILKLINNKEFALVEHTPVSIKLCRGHSLCREVGTLLTRVNVLGNEAFENRNIEQ